MNTIKPRIGYASQNIDISPNTFRTCRLERLTEPLLIELITHNLQVLDAMIDYSICNRNHMLRISSSLIPFASSPVNTLDWATYFSDAFSALNAKIRAHDIRISTHPGQYTVINAIDSQVVDQSMRELWYHHTLLELLSGRQRDKMVLHIGGIYGDKHAAMQRFVDSYAQNAYFLRKHLIIENDVRLFTIEDVLSISEKTGIPVVFDNLHHAINPSLETLSVSQVLELVRATWSPKDGNPKMHYSQQALHKRKGAHTITLDLDKFIYDYENDYRGHGFDIMLEVKDKNRSFIKINATIYPSKKVLEVEWSRYKYWVLARSQWHYLAIRRLLKESSPNVLEFYRFVDQSIMLENTTKHVINAQQHMWGYFKNLASSREKEQFLGYLEDLRRGNVTEKKGIMLLRKLAKKYNQTYLLNSYYLNQATHALYMRQEGE